MEKDFDMDSITTNRQKEANMDSVIPVKKRGISAVSNTVPNTVPMAPVKTGKKGIVLPVLLFCALVVAVGAAGYFYIQLAEFKKNPQKLTQSQVQAVVNKVSRLIVLPEGETPTIATVTDASLLKDQPFFDSAQKGDQLLLYTTAKKAILYSPASHKIVNVAPINIGNNQAVQNTPTIPDNVPDNTAPPNTANTAE